MRALYEERKALCRQLRSAGLSRAEIADLAATTVEQVKLVLSS